MSIFLCRAMSLLSSYLVLVTLLLNCLYRYNVYLDKAVLNVSDSQMTGSYLVHIMTQPGVMQKATMQNVTQLGSIQKLPCNIEQNKLKS